MSRQQSALIADLEQQRHSLTTQHEAAGRRCESLQRQAAAYSQVRS